MTESSETPGSTRNIWIRGLFMLFMGLALYVCLTVLGIVALIQFAMTLLTDAPNTRLTAFGRSLGSYVRQIVNFLTFAAEEIPFPFADWPSAE